MKRRHILGAALAAPFVASLGFAARHAAAAERTIGFISPQTKEAMAAFFGAFKAGLDAHLPRGAEPVRIIERYTGGDLAAVTGHVRELEQLGVRLIVTQGAAALVAVPANPSVPIVFGYSGDPVVAGIAQSLARPGGNATGVTFMSIELNPKRIDMVRSILPNCRKVALLSNVHHFGEEKEIAACQGAVAPVGIELSIHRVQTAAEAKTALAQALDGGAEAVVVLPSGFMIQQTPVFVAGCIERRVPLVSGWSSIARAGALLTYGPNLNEAFKRVAHAVVRVLGGAAPATLPIEQPSVFELAINLKTAAALGLTLPPSLLAQAEEIIE